MSDREEIQQFYIRVCRDSQFLISSTDAAVLTGAAMNISPLAVWCAFSGLDLMERIASGKHPASRAEAVEEVSA